MKILGIDPGLRNTGFAVIEQSGKDSHYIVSGVIKTDAKHSLAERIGTIIEGINQVVREYQPDIASVEKVFVNINPQSTLMLGQARGACIAACVINKLEVSEYTALQVKQAVVGYGHAEKSQIQKMVVYLLKLSKSPQVDAADAIACALAHIHYERLGNIFSMESVKKGRMRN